MTAKKKPERVRRPAPAGDALVQLGRRIREVRMAKGLSMEELGQPYVTRAGVSRIELGLSSPSYRLLVHFSRQLKVPIHRLIPR